MYVEFVYIFVGLGILAVLMAASIVLQISILKKLGKVSLSNSGYGRNNFGGMTSSVANSIVFCKNCGKQYDSKHNVCPSCGAFRK